MIYFDELSATKEMEESQSFKNGYTKTDLFMYTKYLKYKKAIESGIDYENITEEQLRSYNQSIECELRAFCERACLDFNYTTKYQDIDFALEYSCKYKLKLPRPLPITQREWNSIMSVTNENYRKMLFIMLVDAKYYKYFSASVESDKPIDEDTVFYVRMTKSEIQKAAKVKYINQSEKDFFLGCINRLGLFDISDSRLCSWFIKFVDISNENIIEYITDYEHLDLYYEKLSGSKTRMALQNFVINIVVKSANEFQVAKYVQNVEINLKFQHIHNEIYVIVAIKYIEIKRKMNLKRSKKNKYDTLGKVERNL